MQPHDGKFYLMLFLFEPVNISFIFSVVLLDVTCKFCTINWRSLDSPKGLAIFVTSAEFRLSILPMEEMWGLP